MVFFCAVIGRFSPKKCTLELQAHAYAIVENEQIYLCISRVINGMSNDRPCCFLFRKLNLFCSSGRRRAIRDLGVSGAITHGRWYGCGHRASLARADWSPIFYTACTHH